MPLYAFVCQNCGHIFETLVSFAQADQPQRCPKCAGHESKRKLSSFAVGGGSGSRVAGGPPAGSRFT
jgi:putative FmdB family regulatory protein